MQRKTTKGEEKFKKMKATIKQLKEDKEVFFKGIEKRNKKIKNLLMDYEKLQAEEKESHKRIGELFPYEQQHFDLVETVNKER